MPLSTKALLLCAERSAKIVILFLLMQEDAQKKSRSGVLCDCEGDFMAAAQGGVDAVVELHEEDVAVLYAAWD